MNLANQTTSDLQARFDAIERSIEGSNRMSYREWRLEERHRMRLHHEAAAILRELSARGVVMPGAPRANSDVHSALQNARDWVARRGFEWDRAVVHFLEELLAYRNTLRRQALTIDDEHREYAVWEEHLRASPEERKEHFRLGNVRGGFVAGLRRGFDLRAEEKIS